MKIKLSQRKVHLEERLDMREPCSRAALLFLPPVTAFYLMQFVYGAWPWQTEILAAAANILCIAAVYFLLLFFAGDGFLRKSAAVFRRRWRRRA